ncbi:hypothetical protein AAP_01292 [Ascosphaera apis ARSEF 7405]|uniref:Uncharacterized protein n=1 Tax=Ascosphaera apis ARSEF 7405 TaxID=392613 RepID=A0A168BQV1_9EURO|nr:hypothetical protein AAP_01292 [Ascosphaera apis ARSEF 7405]
MSSYNQTSRASNAAYTEMNSQSAPVLDADFFDNAVDVDNTTTEEFSGDAQSFTSITDDGMLQMVFLIEFREYISADTKLAFKFRYDQSTSVNYHLDLSQPSKNPLNKHLLPVSTSGATTYIISNWPPCAKDVSFVTEDRYNIMPEEVTVFSFNDRKMLNFRSKGNSCPGDVQRRLRDGEFTNPTLLGADNTRATTERAILQTIDRLKKTIKKQEKNRKRTIRRRSSQKQKQITPSSTRILQPITNTTSTITKDKVIEEPSTPENDLEPFLFDLKLPIQINPEFSKIQEAEDSKNEELEDDELSTSENDIEPLLFDLSLPIQINLEFSKIQEAEQSRLDMSSLLLHAPLSPSPRLIAKDFNRLSVSAPTTPVTALKEGLTTTTLSTPAAADNEFLSGLGSLLWVACAPGSASPAAAPAFAPAAGAAASPAAAAGAAAAAAPAPASAAAAAAASPAASAAASSSAAAPSPSLSSSCPSSAFVSAFASPVCAALPIITAIPALELLTPAGEFDVAINSAPVSSPAGLISSSAMAAHPIASNSQGEAVRSSEVLGTDSESVAQGTNRSRFWLVVGSVVVALSVFCLNGMKYPGWQSGSEGSGSSVTKDLILYDPASFRFHLELSPAGRVAFCEEHADQTDNAVVEDFCDTLWYAPEVQTTTEEARVDPALVYQAVLTAGLLVFVGVCQFYY